MKRSLVFITLILCFGMSVFAQSDAVKEANILYARGNFVDAAKEYEKVIKNEGFAPELYYNLGNAYYKSNEIGLSILNYERALRLSPTFDDARYNLELAQQKVVDNIVQTPTFFLGRWILNLIKLLSSNQWLYISLTVFIFTLLFVFLFLFGNSHQLRKISFYAGSILLISSLVGLTFSGIRKNQLINHDEAIVMTGVVSVKSSPDKSGTDLFQLHEGTKVTVKSTLGNWTEIKLGNGNVGWVEQSDIEQI